MQLERFFKTSKIFSYLQGQRLKLFVDLTILTKAAVPMGAFRRTVPPAGLTGSRGLMVVAVTEPGVAGGVTTAPGGAVIRDCWLLSSVCRRAGRLFCGDTHA